MFSNEGFWQLIDRLEGAGSLLLVLVILIPRVFRVLTTVYRVSAAWIGAGWQHLRTRMANCGPLGLKLKVSGAATSADWSALQRQRGAPVDRLEHVGNRERLTVPELEALLRHKPWPPAWWHRPARLEYIRGRLYRARHNLGRDIRAEIGAWAALLDVGWRPPTVGPAPNLDIEWSVNVLNSDVVLDVELFARPQNLPECLALCPLVLTELNIWELTEREWAGVSGLITWGLLQVDRTTGAIWPSRDLTSLLARAGKNPDAWRCTLNKLRADDEVASLPLVLQTLIEYGG